MRAPLSWLREFVAIDEEPGALAERLSLSGLTVEEVVRLGAEVRGVVVGEVRAIAEHPDADTLMLVRAFDGERERDIVCGARNYAVGDRVPLALPGARLPGGMEIAQRVVRGKTSDGMLCSARELALADDHSGILLLDRDAPTGKDIGEEIGDVVFHFDITTNRGDLLSVAGIAREIAALYDLPFSIPTPTVVESDEDVAALATVTVADARGCPRYVARVASDVRIGMSPWWMRRRLLASGMRPISNVVDVTNYVLLERGQPLHAFDLDRIAEHAIVVRKPRKGERITTLDGQDRALERGDVVICDARAPIAVAGVMGGGESEVSDATTRIVLESATFDPIRVRATAARLGLRTEASARFEKGSDPELPPSAADRAAELLVAVAGARVARGMIDSARTAVRIKPITLRTARASTIIGAPQETAKMARSLRALGCEVEERRSFLRVTRPSWRPDLSVEVDLIEEVARFFGYENVPARLPGGGQTGDLTGPQRARRAARALLLGAGLNEAQTLSLIPPGVPDRLALPADHPFRSARRVRNPLSEEESVLRTSLLPGLLLAAERNAARRVLPVRLFEIGVVFDPTGDERWSIAWVMTGPSGPTWASPERAMDYFDAKGALDTLLEGLGVPYRIERDDGADALTDPGRIARALSANVELGSVGEFHPRVAAAFDLPVRVAFGTLDLDAVITAIAGSAAVAPSRLPAVHRDLALVVPSSEPAASVETAIREAAGPVLGSLRLFDRYEGEQVPDGSVSLAFGLTLRDPERTLTDGEADAVVGAVVAAARSRGWSVRA